MKRISRRGLRALLEFSAVFLLLLPAGAIAQGIRVTTQAAPISALSISDVDFLNTTTPKWLFTISVSNNTGRPQVSVSMQIDLSVSLDDGESFPHAVTFVSRAFTVETIRNITNLDLVRGGAIGDSLYEKDPAAKSRFEQVALPSGVLPSGSYKFAVSVTELRAGSNATDEFSIVLTNPSNLELLFPFDGDDAVNPFPLFQWNFDGRTSHISVFERLPGQATLEETASGVPQLSADVPGTSFQYPTSGVRPLLPGHTYVWFVEGRIPSVGGAETVIRSTLRSFTVANAGVASLPSLLDELERALDPKYKPVFDQLRAEGMSPTGTIRLNGSPVSQGDLLRLISVLRSDPESVLSVRVE